MANFFQNTITLFLLNKETDTYDRVVIHNVYFRDIESDGLNNYGVGTTSNGTITIPSNISMIGSNYALSSYNNETPILEFVLEGILADTMWNLNESSYVVKGEYTDNIDSIEDIADICFRIISVGDFRKGKLQHIKLGVAR